MKKKSAVIVTLNLLCSICGKKFSEYGNNARPVNDGRCCDVCNQEHVIPARIARVFKDNPA